MSEVRSADGTVLAFDATGSGPAVILVAGAMCYRDSGPLGGLATELAPTHTVYLYDRRGRGGSGDTLPYSVDREIDDLAALIDAAGGRAALFGMSSGGALAVRAAARLGDAVTHLAVFEPPYMPEAARPAAAEYSRALTAALGAGDRDAAVAAFLTRVGMPAGAVEGLKRSPMWPGMTAIAPTLAYDDAAMSGSAIPAVVADVHAPTLALAGDASPELLQWGAREVARAARDGRFAPVLGAGHDADAAALAPHLRTFIG